MTPDTRPTAATADRDTELRQMLERQRDDILESTRLRIHDVRTGAADHDVIDEGEMSDADMQLDLDFALLQMAREKLIHIDAALAQLDEGTYGRCVSCGGEIATRRLRAQPFAVRCTACEHAHEQAQQASSGAVNWRWQHEGFVGLL